MKKTCKECGMIRSVKDLVKLEDGENYLCFPCWNKYLEEKGLLDK